MAIIEVKGLKKNYGELEVLKSINLEIEEGQVVCIIGPSGSGKSTFLRCLNRLEKTTAGKVIVDGYDLTDKNKSVIAIANNVSGREIGAPLTNFALKIIKEKLYLKQDYCLHYQGVSISGKNLRSCTQFIKENGKLLGMLCINFDDTRYQEFKDTVLHLCHPDHFIEKYYSTETARRSINIDSTEKFHNMAEDVAADAIDYEIAKIGVEPERLTAEERIHIIATLEENGIFLL